MADNIKRVPVEIRRSDRTVANVSCPEHLIHLLQDSSTDDSVKESITNLISEKCTFAAIAVVPKPTWNETTEKLVLEQFKIVDAAKPSKCKWKTIATNVNAFGYNFTAEQCRLKVKTLKEKYERNKKTANTSGESPPSDDNTSELDDTFDTFPDMNPAFTVDSGRPNPEEPSTSTSVEDVKDEKVKDEDLLGGPAAKKRKPVKRSIDHMLDYLETSFEKTEVAAKTRHNEKMELLGSLIGVLKDVAQK